MGISEDLYNLLENYLLGRLQRDILNRHNLTAELVLAGVPRVQFRTYSLVKLFGDGTSLFTIVKDKQGGQRYWDILGKFVILELCWDS